MTEYAAAARAAEEFESSHGKAKAQWNVAQSALRMRADWPVRRWKRSHEDEILAEEALDSVRSAMNEEMRSR